jgi:hypothetical protein
MISDSPGCTEVGGGVPFESVIPARRGVLDARARGQDPNEMITLVRNPY